MQTMQSTDSIQYAKNQAQDHAEFIGEYAKYIYRLGHEHGFKHGFDYAIEKHPQDYLDSCKIVAKHMQEEEE